MAKGQKKSTKEKRKPKQEKKPATVVTSGFTFNNPKKGDK